MTPAEEEIVAEHPLPTDAERDRLRALLEAALFASPEPVPLPHLARALGQPLGRIRFLLEEWSKELAHRARGLQLRTVAGGYRLSTKAEHHEPLREVFENLPPPAPLSRAALETVTIIALKQPVTAAEIQELRGVQNSDPLRTLLRRKLIAPAGRAKTRGYPVRYKTTQRYLVEFGLESLAELRTAPELRHRPRLTVDSD